MSFSWFLIVFSMLLLAKLLKLDVVELTWPFITLELLVERRIACEELAIEPEGVELEVDEDETVVAVDD
jgi:hypothetical protein